MKLRKTSILQAIILSGLVAFASVNNGCRSPQKTSYRVAATTTVSAEAAVRNYNVFAAAGKTTVAQNQRVKAQYEKYQLAFSLLCDAGADYAAAGSDPASPAAAVFQSAIANSAATLLDLTKLLNSFGLK